MTALAAEQWTSADDSLPDNDCECLCWVFIPRRVRNGRVTPSQRRYMALEFEVGAGFWIHGGLPKGMVTHWIELQQPRSTAVVGGGDAS